MENLIKLIEAVLNDEKIPDTPAGEVFSEKQWDALCGYTEMTQEIFNKCLEICNVSKDNIMFWHIVKQFPEFKVNYSEKIKSAHRRAYEQAREEYIAEYGTGYFYD